jgi:hypothetical protein
MLLFKVRVLLAPDTVTGPTETLELKVALLLKLRVIWGSKEEAPLMRTKAPTVPIPMVCTPLELFRVLPVSVRLANTNIVAPASMVHVPPLLMTMSSLAPGRVPPQLAATLQLPLAAAHVLVAAFAWMASMRRAKRLSRTLTDLVNHGSLREFCK